VKSELGELVRLPLCSMWTSLCHCWSEAKKEGEKHILYNAGQRFYNQLVSNEANGNNCDDFLEFLISS